MDYTEASKELERVIGYIHSDKLEDTDKELMNVP